jgi:peptidoglycan hydrolase CwlO-like protein
VPLRNKDAVQHRFREAINRQFDALKIDNSNRNVFNFRSKIESLTDNARGLSKVRSEREKYMIKLKQLENDLILLDNNIGFFANSKNAQALIADVNQKIRDTREKIEQLKEKIRIIDDLDKSEY